MQLFRFQKGFSPVLVINAGSGTILLPEIADTMTDAGLAKPDTDWHLSRILDLPVLESAAMLTANLSRYVIDLSKPQATSRGEAQSELVPLTTKTGEEIYRSGNQPSPAEIAKRIEHFYQPFYQQLESECQRLVGRFGSAIVLDFYTNRPDPNQTNAPRVEFAIGPECPPELRQLVHANTTAATSDDLKIVPADVASWAAHPRNFLNTLQVNGVFGVAVGIDQHAYLDLDDQCIDLAGIQLVIKQLEFILLPILRWGEQQ